MKASEKLVDKAVLHLPQVLEKDSTDPADTLKTNSLQTKSWDHKPKNASKNIGQSFKTLQEPEKNFKSYRYSL